jgi:hypothetical protein
MIKLKYIASIILCFGLCFSCKNNVANTESTNIETDIDFEEKCQPISDYISSELRAYQNREPLPRVDKGIVHPSYFLSFFEENQDTFMMMGYQPYVLEIFPDYAIKSKLKNTPKEIGFAEINSYPLIVYDLDNKLGSHMYNLKCLNAQISKDFYIKPDSFLTHVGPLRLYKIEGIKLNFKRDIDRMILK